MLERREMFAELLCVAAALVLYVNTLGADFCYDDRYFACMDVNEFRVCLSFIRK